MASNRPALDISTDHVVIPGEELSPIELSDELRAELLDPEVWSEVLKTYAATTRLAVALTDALGHLVGGCHNPQPLWRTVKGAGRGVEGACSFCLAPPAPCTAVAEALRTGEVVIVRDGAGLAHVAVPLSLGGRHVGALIAGQVFSRYPEPLPLQRVANRYGVSPQQLWHQATREVPITEATLRVYANLLMSLGNAYLGKRYAGILQRKTDATNLRYRLLIDGVQDYALYTIDRAGCVVSWNSGAEHMFGYTEAEILGQNSSCLSAPEDIQREVILQEADRQGWVESEGWRIRKDGVRFFVTGVVAPLGQGEAREYGILIRDVTERRRSQESMLQAQKLESIGVLAGGIAHDFNNLLTGIMGSVTLAKTSLPPDHSAYPVLEVAERSSERAAELTAQLLAYAGKGKFVITRFDFSALVTEMLPLIEAFVPKTVQLQLFLKPELPWIEGDASQIRQIVMNLIINGAEAIGSGGGTVRVSSGVRNHPGVTEKGVVVIGKPGSYVYLEVKDSGSGMSEAIKAKIFDPFFTTKFTGRGLGLAAVAGILRGHQGRMDVESILGEGTTFTIFFPAVGPIVSSVVNPRPSIEQGTGAILFVDDEPALRKIAKLVLEKYGYSVLVAKDGQEAVDIFRQNARRIATVLLDMTMPIMGGREAFHLIREIHPDVPIILMSGFNEDVAREDLGAAAVAGFVQKPYSVAKLVATIRAGLTRIHDSEFKARG